MDFKSIEEVMSHNKDRMNRVREKFTTGSDTDDEVSKCTNSEAIFCVNTFMQNHKEAKFENLTNFKSEELDELVKIVEENRGSGCRGRRSQVSLKGCLFLALSYFTTYIPLETLSGIVGVKVPTLERIIDRVVFEFFPVFVKKFIPVDLSRSKVLFVNFPDAVGAIDSTTIRTYRSQKFEKQKATWDAKKELTESSCKH